MRLSIEEASFDSQCMIRALKESSKDDLAWYIIGLLSTLNMMANLGKENGTTKMDLSDMEMKNVVEASHNIRQIIERNMVERN